MTTMTTSTSAFYDRARNDMTSLRLQAEKLQTQIGAQTRLTKSSDDPVAASRMRNLSRSDTLSQIDTANAARATADLNLADSTMSDITNAISQAKVLATQAASGTLTDGQRDAIGKQISAINDTILSLVNTQDSNGHALFGGENATTAYKLDASGNAVYTGTATTGQLPLGEGQTVTRSMTGPEFLRFTADGKNTDVMATLKTLADALQGGVADPAAAARSSLDALSSGLDAVSTGQTIVGTRLAWIDMTTDRATKLNETRASEEADVGGIDLASSVAKLQQMMVVLQASQASFTKMSSLSLFNQLN